MVERRLLRNFDFSLLMAALCIIVFGFAMIYSAIGIGYMQKQMMWAIVGLAAGIVLTSIDHTIYSRIAGKLYIINILMLLAVRVIGTEVNGAKSWIGFGPMRFQPSEVGKIVLILTLAVFVVKRLSTIRTTGTFALSFVYTAIPMFLVFLQPDLGTSLVMIAVWITMVFVMGTDVKNVVAFVAVVALIGLVGWNVPGVMKPHQKQRIITFVNPGADPQGSGYHVAQSKIAIGSGHILGKGFQRGTQRELGFIPEKHTDFIFSVVGEELGFAGASAVIILYFILIWRALEIMSSVEDPTGRAIAAGVAGMFLFHVVVNLGMTMGIMPVTGVPLPMFSYGGSSLMANLMAIGLLEGVSMRRHKISF